MSDEDGPMPGYSSASDIEESNRQRAPRSINPFAWIRYALLNAQRSVARVFFARRHPRGPEPAQIGFTTMPVPV
jgi:hypothetical protein